MTCIELFDYNFADNICSCLSCSPERVILLGKENKILKHAERYNEIFKSRGYNTEFSSVIIERSDMSKIIDTLAELVEKYDDCTFDVTGGDDRYLVAVGIILERYKGRVQAHYIDARTGDMMDCDCDGKILGKIQTPQLTCEENIKLYGGKIKKIQADLEWKLDNDFLRDLEKMWEICASDNTEWNIQTSYLASIAMSSFSEDGLDVQCTMKKIRELKLNTKNDKSFNVNFMEKLYDKGIIRDYFCDKKQICFRFKNEQIKRCLTKSGQVLELVVYSTAKNIKEGGKNFYSDAETGVNIEWDDKNNNVEGDDVLNEVDVILMKGMIPVFISCKNGSFSSDELFKLFSVTEKFGGKYAKKIVITTSKERAKSMRPRATELKIGIVHLYANMSKEKLEKKIKNLWLNNG